MRKIFLYYVCCAVYSNSVKCTGIAGKVSVNAQQLSGTNVDKSYSYDLSKPAYYIY